MKLTKTKLQQIIKEEVGKLNEASVQTLLGLPSMGKIDSAQLIAAVTEKINSGEVKEWEQTNSTIMQDLSQFLSARVRDERDSNLRAQLKQLSDEFDQVRGRGTSPQTRARQQGNREYWRSQAGQPDSGFKDFYSGQLEEKIQ